MTALTTSWYAIKKKKERKKDELIEEEYNKIKYYSTA